MSRLTRGPDAALPVRGCHPLWPTFPDRSGSMHQATGLVRFRSPLLAESRLMSFPPATEMFQFAGFASPTYGFSRRWPKRAGLPHSEIRGSKGARPSPRLFAACHVLHRLSVPRHPPNALTRLIQGPAAAHREKTPCPRHREASTYTQHSCYPPGRPPGSRPPGLATPRPGNPKPAASRIPIHNVKEQISGIGHQGSEKASRPWPVPTRFVPRIASLVEPTGIEPATPCLQSRCSPS